MRELLNLVAFQFLYSTEVGCDSIGYQTVRPQLHNYNVRQTTVQREKDRTYLSSPAFASISHQRPPVLILRMVSAEQVAE